MSVTAIGVEALHKSFASEAVLVDLGLDVEDGEFCVVVGPSGCGKSTLLKCIAGLTSVDEGTVRLYGHDAAELTIEERDLGYVFQEFEETLFPHMTVRENVAFGLEQRSRGLSEADRTERIDEMLSLLAIGETRDNRPAELSGGQQQRVELARQLVRQCDVMLLDDPLADLDYKLQKRMELEMRRLHRELGSTFLYVTHNQDQALKLADKLVIMNRGMIEQIGSPQAVYDRPETAFVGRFVGDSNVFVGSVVDERDDTVVVDTEVGAVEATAATGVGDGAESIVLVRPERVAIGDAARTRDNTFDATLVGETYTGETTEFALEIEGLDREIELVKPGRPDVGTPGDRVSVGWDAADAQYFSQLSVTGAVSVDDLMRV